MSDGLNLLEEIDGQFQLLVVHRRTLGHLLQQSGVFGVGFVPAHIANGIVDARSNIVRIKANLRAKGQIVDDDPNDESPVQGTNLNVVSLNTDFNDIFSLHLTIIPEDPTFIQGSKRRNWGNVVSPQALVVNKEIYMNFVNESNKRSEIDINKMINKIPIYETSSPSLVATLTYDAEKDSSTIIIQGLALEVLYYEKIEDPFVLKYSVGGADVGWVGGEAVYSDKKRLYPIKWETKYSYVPEERILENFSIIPGEVQVFNLHFLPKSDVDTGIYYMRIVLKGIYKGKDFLISSNKIFRCVVLGESWFAYEGIEVEDEVVENLRRGAYMDIKDFFRYLKSTNPNSAMEYETEIMLAENNSNAKSTYLKLLTMVRSNNEFFIASKYSWLLRFLGE